MQVSCPHCGTLYPLTSSLKGKTVECGVCKREFTMPRAVAAPVDPTAPPPGEDDIRSCPFCAETIKVKARICRYCGADLVLNRPPAAVHDSRPDHHSLPAQKPLLDLCLPLLLVPLAATALAWIWLPGVAMINDPGGKLLLIAGLTFVSTGVLASTEIAQRRAAGVRTIDSPVSTFIGFVILWVFAYPFYMIRRSSRLVKGSYAVAFAGFLTAAATVATFAYLLYRIESRKTEIRAAFDDAQRALESIRR